jgi:xanthine dehydrogenase iron-sulfur cluster and FAD-binding subunit A
MNFPEIKFQLNGAEACVSVPPAMPLQQVLRDVLRLTGTKDGCREGECGACSVLLDGAAVDSCLVPVCQVEGREVLTIEAFSKLPSQHHPLIQSFIENGAVQCGFCSPGFIIAAAGLLMQNPNPSRDEIKRALAGNLCRCTGYGKIVAAVEQAKDSFYLPECTGGYHPGSYAFPDDIRVIKLKQLSELAQMNGMNWSGVRFLAGGTDLMVQKSNSKPHGDLWIDICGCRELSKIELAGNELRIGAMMNYYEIGRHPLVNRYAQGLASAAEQLGSDPIARRATIGGNLANASPAADGYPPLAALHASVTALIDGSFRQIGVSELAVKPGVTALAPGELITEIRIPVSETLRSKFYKAMPRNAQCLAKVSIAVAVDADGGSVNRCGIALGAVGPTVIRAAEAEQYLLSTSIDHVNFERVVDLAAKAARPINDFRSDTSYRLRSLRTGAERLLRELLT